MLDTYSDFSASSLNPAFYAQPLQRAGLITPGGAAKNGLIYFSFCSPR